LGEEKEGRKKRIEGRNTEVEVAVCVYSIDK